MVEPFLRLEGLPIADTSIQHHLSRTIKSVAEVVPGYDTVLSPLGQLSQLENANSILRSWWWQSKAATQKPHGQESYMEKAKHVRCVQKKAKDLVGELHSNTDRSRQNTVQTPQAGFTQIPHSSAEQFCPTALLLCHTTPNQCFKSVLKYYQ